MWVPVDCTLGMLGVSKHGESAKTGSVRRLLKTSQQQTKLKLAWKCQSCYSQHFDAALQYDPCLWMVIARNRWTTPTDVMNFVREPACDTALSNVRPVVLTPAFVILCLLLGDSVALNFAILCAYLCPYFDASLLVAYLTTHLQQVTRMVFLPSWKPHTIARRTSTVICTLETAQARASCSVCRQTR